MKTPSQLNTTAKMITVTIALYSATTMHGQNARKSKNRDSVNSELNLIVVKETKRKVLEYKIRRFVVVASNKIEVANTNRKNKANEICAKVFGDKKIEIPVLKCLLIRKHKENEALVGKGVEIEYSTTAEAPELTRKFRIHSIVGLGFAQPLTHLESCPMSLMLNRQVDTQTSLEAGVSMSSFGKTQLMRDVSAKNKIGMYNFELRAAKTFAMTPTYSLYYGGRLGLSYYSNVNADFQPYKPYDDGVGSKLIKSNQLLFGTEISFENKRHASVELSTWSPKVIALGVTCSL